MKKIVSMTLALLLVLTVFTVSAAAESAASAQEEPDWTLPDTIEMTSTVTAMFNQAMEGLTGVSYEALAFLGEKDGTYCVLCRGTAVYPDAKPGYALVYVNDTGVQNIWEIWMDKHANP